MHNLSRECCKYNSSEYTFKVFYVINYIAIIKTSSSESRDQEEGACACIFSPTHSELFTQMAAQNLKFCSSATVTATYCVV